VKSGVNSSTREDAILSSRVFFSLSLMIATINPCRVARGMRSRSALRFYFIHPPPSVPIRCSAGTWQFCVAGSSSSSAAGSSGCKKPHKWAAKRFRQNVALAMPSAMLLAGLRGVSLVFCRPIILLGMAAVAALSLCACGRNGSLELPPGPAGIQQAPAALSAPPPGPVASDASALPPPGATAGIQPAPAASSAPPPGPVASDASAALPTSQDTIAKTGFDAHGNPAATPGQKKPFFLDWLLQ
jgi:hypothetical protein